MKIVKAGMLAGMACSLVLTMAPSPGVAQQARPMSDSDRKQVERLHTDVKQLDADGASTASTPEGRRRVTERIAKQFKVSDSVVDGLRNRKMGYGEVTVALALSEALMKQDKSLTQQQALDTILSRRAAGQGWGQIAHSMDLKLGHLISEVKKADKQVDRVKADKVARADKPDKIEKPEKPQRVEKPDRPEKPGR
jgi:hypothetical protein